MTGFEYEVFIDASPEQVWAALRDRDQLRRWHGWHTEGLDEEIELIYFTRATESGHLLTLGDGTTFTVIAKDGRALLRMVRAPKGGNPEWDAYYEDINEGWTTFMQQLRFALERHDGVDRLTHYFNHEGSTERVGEILELVKDSPVGAGYDVTPANGERLTGQVWFRSPNQVGLTVQGWGDGLLVAGQVPVSEQHPTGGEMMVLTFFDEHAFADAEKRWQF
ncbi:hypothetical protein Rhe02_21860 [Rhizocola hellebori]|uniref:SRPBCC domain-containing protein n=1 Tax=Rhizocola hellebori TaxID=1392758 RepID=A0A8J3VE20_9ACTN|nr:SRPBCC domain-containing protein [Rhizocola hellebori]GIH04119.1 hypothetical protein Rhe02_21860 [Rhizocola hellebori]